jgi:NitT/TauT family transport system substrate-binding protein
VVDLGLLESPATKGKGFGYNAPEDWERSLKLMIDYRELKTDRPASSFYVNDFITQ